MLFVVGEGVEAEGGVGRAEIFQVKITDGVPGGGRNSGDIKDFFFPGVGGGDGDIPGLFGGDSFADAELKNVGAGNVTLDPDANVTIERHVNG